MEIVKVQIKIRDLVKGYTDNQQTGQVTGYDGKLDIRPAYQREFVYKDKQRDAVINTVVNGFPLNIIYWAKKDDGTFEVLDGQQRTISICQYCNDEFSIDYRYFHNLTQGEKDTILDYELDVYQCSGTDKEKLDWFRIINIAGEKLTDQELLNAVYAGTWLTDAKRRFSARNCAAERLAKDYLNGSAIRQNYLETALEWISAKDNTTVEDYMAKHQNDTNASALWLYFQSVINWVTTLFTVYRKEMKGLEWGILYNKYKDGNFDPTALEERVKALMMDDEIRKRNGIYEYLLSGDEKKLSIRVFSDNQKRIAYEKQNGVCVHCGEKFEYSEMDGDHILPWRDGGKTEQSNCQMLCRRCNRSNQ